MGKNAAADTDTNRRDIALAHSLRVLIVGGSEAVAESANILESLLTAGYGVTLLGIIDRAADYLDRVNGSDAEGQGLRLLEQLLSADPPDLIIVTAQDTNIALRLARIVPDGTRVLDSFALRILQSHKDAMRQLNATRNRLESVEFIKETLLSGSGTGLIIVDENLNVLEISSSLQKRSGLTRDQCLNKPCHWVMRDCLEACNTSKETCLAREVFRTGKAVHTVREEPTENDSARYYSVSGHPLPSTETGEKAALIIWRDITSQLNIVLDRQAQNIKENFIHFLQQDKLVALGKLAAAAVHEINNPIQGILAFAKLMRKKLEDGSLSAKDVEQFRTYLDLIAGESARCGQILRNLLSFSRQSELKASSFSIAPLLDEIALLLGNRMELQQVSLHLELADDLPKIYGDRDQIKQGLLNVALNAIEAMPNGGTITIRGETLPDSTRVRIRVEDTGTGVPKDIQHNIFEPFFSTKTDEKGVGLGLSVLFGILSQHGGTVEVESSEGKGAAFILTLPTADAGSASVESRARVKEAKLPN
ncbi:MAG: ATP-binding protein [Thermodesulfobacteriota bacterium]